MPTPATATHGTRLNSAVVGIVRLISGHHALGWADQAVVSAVSFLLMVMIGRWSDASELGAYATGVSVLMLLIATQESLITRPYSIQLHRPAGTPQDYAFSALSLSAFLGGAAALITGSAALLLFAFDADRRLIEVGWALTGALPFVLMREFARRFALAHLAVARAVLLDCAVAVLMLVALAALSWSGRLSAATALVVIGVVCGLGSFGWLYLTRHDFSWSFRQLEPTLQRSWRMGKWFLAGQIALQAQGYMTPWLALILAGSAVTGVYAACASIVAFANPLIFGFFNVLLPKSVRTLREQGARALRRQVCDDTLFLTGIMAAFSLVIFAFGDDIMRLVYRGEAFAGYGHVLTVLATASLTAAVGVPASIALAAAERPRSVTFVTALSAMLSLILVSVLLPHWGLLGAAYGVLAAEMAGSAGRWLAFLLLVPNTVATPKDQQPPG